MSSRKRSAPADLFDLGDDCNDAPESIGEYDCSDDFIDDEPIATSPSEHLRGRRRVRQRERSPSASDSVSWPASPLFEPEAEFVEDDHSTALSAPATQTAPDVAERSDASANPAPGPSTDAPSDVLAALREPKRRLDKDGKPTGSFRCNSRRLLLTIAKAGDSWSYQPFVDYLQELGAKLRLGRELHKDGTPHYHCYVDFERNYQFEGSHHFCFGPFGNSKRRTCSGTGHINISVIWKTPHHVWNYLHKDGPECILIDTTDGCPTPSAAKDNRRAEGKYCFDASTRDEFLARVQEVDPWTFIKSFSNVVATGQHLYPDAPPAKFEPIEGLIFRWKSFPTTTEWILASLPGGADRIRRLAGPVGFHENDERRARARIPPQLVGGRPKSLILWGESLHGKTDLATHLGAHIHWMGDYRLQDIADVGVDNIDYIVIDDIDWDSTLLKGSAYKRWLGGQKEFVATDKWVKKLRVSWGKPCIFLCNDNPLDFVSATHARFLEKNCFIEEVREGQYVTRRPDIYT